VKSIRRRLGVYIGKVEKNARIESVRPDTRETNIEHGAGLANLGNGLTFVDTAKKTLLFGGSPMMTAGLDGRGKDKGERAQKPIHMDGSLSLSGGE